MSDGPEPKPRAALIDRIVRRRHPSTRRAVLGGALLRLRDVEHVDGFDAADFAIIDLVRGDPPDAFLALRDHAVSGEPAVERVNLGRVGAGAEEAAQVRLGVGAEGHERRERLKLRGQGGVLNCSTVGGGHTGILSRGCAAPSHAEIGAEFLLQTAGFSDHA
jgi:hypothetical protein